MSLSAVYFTRTYFSLKRKRFLTVVGASVAAVVNNVLKTRDNISVPFTTAEFAVVKTACSVSRYRMGIDI